MPPEETEPAAKCPVDHETRERWLEAAKARGQQTPAHPVATAASSRDASSGLESATRGEKLRINSNKDSGDGRRVIDEAAAIQAVINRQKQRFLALHSTGRTRFSLDSGRWELSYTQRPSSSQGTGSQKPTIRSLSNDREVSSIPRAISTNVDDKPLNSAEQAALPANSEHDTGHDRDSGNWIYPSQEMFFSAMRRKGHDPQTADMSTIVPIHNAVNEQAWAEILAWERGRGSETCGGPKLVSFAGDSKALTPRARWNGLLGYQTPFDRHDWVVDRCGRRVEYVIDFYQGKEGVGLAGAGGKGLSFYLDVRPKVNSWEGLKMRVLRAAGM